MGESNIPMQRSIQKEDLSPEAGEQKNGFPRFELAILLAVIALFFAINLLTTDKSPVVWTDEVMYADPAINFYQGHGFTSAAWYAQSMDRFWAGNVPLYQFVLIGWLKLFGFSLLKVRSLHYVLFGLATIVAWAAVRRLGLITVPAHRLLFSLSLLFSSASLYAYRMARPESLCMLLLASLLYAFSLKPRLLRLVIVAALGTLLVCTGLQMGPYLFLLCGLLWFIVPRSFRFELVVLCAGCVAALGLLFFFYTSHGVWDEFIRSIRLHTIVNKGVHSDVIAGYGSGLSEKLRTLLSRYMDYSLMALLVAAAIMAWRLWRAGLLKKTSPFLFGLLAALIVPVVLHLVAVFNLYYSWLAFTPLAVGVCAELRRQFTLPPISFARFVLPGLIVLACLVGLPRRLVVAAFEWQARNYTPIMRLADPYVPANAVIYSEQAAYYAAKQHGATVILPTHYGMLGEKEKSRVSVAIVENTDATSLTHNFGGTWHEVAAFDPPPPRSPVPGLHEELSSGKYHLKVFLRDR